MAIKDDFYVKKVKPEETHNWLINVHYAARLPMAIEYSFGLFKKDNSIQGVCTFGPTAPPVPLTLFGTYEKYKVRELTRLVVNDGLEKNALSFFVSQCLSMLPSPIVIISFADSSMGHHGYIYQATNWLYTGIGGAGSVYRDSNGKELHALTIGDRAEVMGITVKEYVEKFNIKITEAEGKYRYLYFVGNKNEIKNMKTDLKLDILPYPKGENKRYVIDYEPLPFLHGKMKKPILKTKTKFFG